MTLEGRRRTKQSCRSANGTNTRIVKEHEKREGGAVREQENSVMHLDAKKKLEITRRTCRALTTYAYSVSARHCTSMRHATRSFDTRDELLRRHEEFRCVCADTVSCNSIAAVARWLNTRRRTVCKLLRDEKVTID